MTNGKIIILNGAPTSGKTNIARTVFLRPTSKKRDHRTGLI